MQRKPEVAPNQLAYGLKTESKKRPNIGAFVELLKRKRSDSSVFFAIRKPFAYKILISPSESVIRRLISLTSLSVKVIPLNVGLTISSNSVFATKI